MSTRERLLSDHMEGNIVGMSEQAVSSTGTKNELEKWKLSNEILLISNDEKMNTRNKGKELRQLRDDIEMMTAESFVYKTHCFGKYDPYKTTAERESFRPIDVRNSFNKDTKKNGNNVSVNSLPSIHRNKGRSTTKKNRDGKEKTENADKNELPILTSRNVNFHDKLLRGSTHTGVHNEKQTSPQKPTGLLRKSLSEGNYLANDEGSFLCDVSSPRSDVFTSEYESDDEGNNNQDSIHPKLLSSLASSFHGLLMWRQRAREKEAEKEIERKATVQKPKRFLPKSVPPQVSPAFKAMFPGNCKTYYAMKRFVHKEAEKMIQHADSPMYEKKRQRLRMLMQRASLPPFIRRDRTTSAIFRDFRSYQGLKNTETSLSSSQQ